MRKNSPCTVFPSISSSTFWLRSPSATALITRATSTGRLHQVGDERVERVHAAGPQPARRVRSSRGRASCPRVPPRAPRGSALRPGAACLVATLLKMSAISPISGSPIGIDAGPRSRRRRARGGRPAAGASRARAIATAARRRPPFPPPRRATRSSRRSSTSSAPRRSRPFAAAVRACRASSRSSRPLPAPVRRALFLFGNFGSLADAHGQHL